MDNPALLDGITNALTRLNGKIKYILQHIDGIDTASMLYQLHILQVRKLERSVRALQGCADHIIMEMEEQRLHADKKIHFLEGLRDQPFIRGHMLTIIDKNVHRLRDARH